MSKPVAYRFKSPLSEEGQWEYGKEPPVGSRWEIGPLYTNPPRREWQGLTDTEIGMEYVKWDATPGASMADFARAIEAALKERNA
jgi:hypothetical protein